MKISCPNCSTGYQVPDGSIGDEGRDVRCANCGETWHAEKEAPEAMDLETGLDSSQGDIDSMFDAPAQEEQSQDDIDSLFDSPSAGEEQSQDDIDSLFDSPSEGEEQSQDDIDSLFDAPESSESQNQDDIDSLFDNEPDDAGSADMITADAADPFVVTGDHDQADGPVVDLMDAAEFEAQKARARGTDVETTARRSNRHAKKAKLLNAEGIAAVSKREWMVGGGALAACLILFLTLMIAPSFWVRTLPDLASLYRMIGMDINVGGVDIETVDVRLVQKAGAPVIAVEAELVNPGADPVILPSVQFSILGNNESELYSWAIDPESVGLGPGERKLIETTVAAPSQAKYISLRIFHQ